MVLWLKMIKVKQKKGIYKHLLVVFISLNPSELQDF
jgi:hypothetical protein